MILNNADNIYIGGTEVEKVMFNLVQIWPQLQNTIAEGMRRLSFFSQQNTSGGSSSSGGNSDSGSGSSGSGSSGEGGNSGSGSSGSGSGSSGSGSGSEGGSGSSGSGSGSNGNEGNTPTIEISGSGSFIYTYRIYGNEQIIDSITYGVGDQSNNQYIMPIVLSNNTYNIILSQPLMIRNGVADYIDYKTQKRYNGDGTTEQVTMPEFILYQGLNYIQVGTQVIPSKIEIMFNEKKLQKYHFIIQETNYKLYGWHLNPNNNTIEYLHDAIGKTPVTMGANSFNYGDWENVFFMPKPCMLKYDGTVDYYLDPNDYFLKEGTSYIESTSVISNIVQGNIWPGYGGHADHNTVSIRCKAATPIVIPPRTFATFSTNNSNVQIALYQADSQNTDAIITLVTNGYESTKTIKNFSENEIYAWPIYTKTNTSMDISPTEFTASIYFSKFTSDVCNASYGGNAMMEWPKIWYKFKAGETDDEGYFYCSDTKIDNSFHCWCNYDSQNNEIDHFYTSIYNSSLIDNKLKSIANTTSITYVEQDGLLNYAKNNNIVQNDVEWYMDVFSDHVLIDNLLILIGKNLNYTSVFGNGQWKRFGTNGTDAQTQRDAVNNYINGELNKKGLFYGSTQDDVTPVKVFGMENYWGHLTNKVMGCTVKRSDQSIIYIKLTYNNIDGSTATSYNKTGTGYLTVPNNLASQNGQIQKMNYSYPVPIPYTVASSNDYGISFISPLPWSDSYTGYYELRRGGIQAQYINMYSFAEDINSSWYHISTRITCKPIASSNT